MTEFDPKNKSEFLWKVIARYDFYINSINSKTALIVAFNTFIITGILLKWADIGTLFINYQKLTSLVNFLLLLIIASSLASLFFVFKAVSPFLETPEDPKKYLSLIFFGHVSQFRLPLNYYEQIEKLDYDFLLEDLSKQAYILAKGTDKKFRYIKKSIIAIIFFQIPSLVLIVLFKYILIFFHIL